MVSVLHLIGLRRRWFAVVACALLCGGCTLFGGNGQSGAIEVSPGEITLCPAQSYQFHASQEGEAMRRVEWDATGGVISSDGFYTAPGEPGDYAVSAGPAQGDSRGLALVHVIPCVDGKPLPPPTPTQLPPPTPPTLTPTAAPPEPTPTATAARSPLPTPTAITTQAVCLDRSGDLARYDTLAPVRRAVQGADIQRASLDDARHPVTTLPPDLRAEIGDWDQETSLILWMTLYQPVPDEAAPGEPDTERYWLFALDLDGDSTTGRPVGDGVINPDMGVEVTIGVKWDPELGAEREPYIYVWNADTGTSDRRTEGVEARFSRARDAVFVRIGVDLLSELVRQYSETEFDPTRAVGRAAALAVTDEGMVADFCPDLP